MATVKFSKDLRERIVMIAATKFAPAVEKAKNAHPVDWGDRLYDIAFGQYLPAMAALPDEFFERRTFIEIGEIVVRGTSAIRVGLKYQFTGKAKPFPAAYPKGCLFQKKGNYSSDISLTDSPSILQFKDEVLAWRKGVANAEKQLDEFKSSVKTIVEAYATLAPALKAWPPLWEILPDDVKRKHKEIKEREKKTVEIGVELDRATALASYSKIRGGDGS